MQLHVADLREPREPPIGGTLTELDQALIAALQVDGRTPFSTLAAMLGIAEATVQRRTQQLIDDGYFKIVGTVDPLRLGQGHAVMVSLKCDPQAIEAISTATSDIPDMRFVALVTGTYDVMCELVTFNRESTVAILTDTLSTIPGVRELNTSWVLANYKTNFQWNAIRRDESEDRYLPAIRSAPPLDSALPLTDLDAGIVSLLQENGRLSYAQLARRLGTTESTARRHALRLLQSGYVTVVALGNPFRLGFEEVVLLSLKVDLARTAEVLQVLQDEPAVRYLSRVAGGADILAEAFFRHRTALLAFLDGPLAAIEGIRDVVLSFELVIHKRAYTRFD